MSIICVIDFEDNAAKIVYSGQILCGTVKLVLSEPKTIRGIILTFTGKVLTYWPRGTGKHLSPYGQSKDFFLDRMYLIGSSHGTIQLSAGLHMFTFQKRIPEQSPTSFEGECGYIRYLATAVVHNALWPNDEFEMRFIVINPVHLNDYPSLHNPLTVRKEKRFFSRNSSSMSDLLTITVSIPVGAYVNGKIIKLNIIVDNKSNQSVNGFKVQLVKEISYYVSVVCFKPKEIFTITKFDTEGCAIGEQKTINVNIAVPETSSTDTNSQFIKMQYYCQIIGSVSRWHKNPTVKVPITIGTHPYSDLLLTEPNENIFDDDTSSTLSLLNENSEANEYLNDGPPTYEQAMDVSK